MLMRLFRLATPSSTVTSTGRLLHLLAFPKTLSSLLCTCPGCHLSLLCRCLDMISHLRLLWCRFLHRFLIRCRCFRIRRFRPLHFTFSGLSTPTLSSTFPTAPPAPSALSRLPALRPLNKVQILLIGFLIKLETLADLLLGLASSAYMYYWTLPHVEEFENEI